MLVRCCKGSLSERRPDVHARRISRRLRVSSLNDREACRSCVVVVDFRTTDVLCIRIESCDGERHCDHMRAPQTIDDGEYNDFDLSSQRLPKRFLRGEGKSQFDKKNHCRRDENPYYISCITPESKSPYLISLTYFQKPLSKNCILLNK